MISVICPFYNEKENLTELFRRLDNVTRSLKESWELIFVDDGSTDGGSALLKSLAQGHKGIHIIEFEHNHGLSTALYAGMMKARGDILATLDADLQNPPEELPRLLELLQDADIAAGIRTRRQDSFVKNSSSRIARWIRSSVTGDTMQDVGCSLRVFRREALKAFYPYRGMHRFFLPLAEAEGFKIKQIPVAHEPRKFGKAKYGLWNRLLGPLWDLLAVHWILTHKIHYQVRGEFHG